MLQGLLTMLWLISFSTVLITYVQEGDVFHFGSEKQIQILNHPKFIHKTKYSNDLLTFNSLG